MVSVPLSIAISTVLLLHKVLIVLEVAGTASIDAGLRIQESRSVGSSKGLRWLKPRPISRWGQSGWLIETGTGYTDGSYVLELTLDDNNEKTVK